MIAPGTLIADRYQVEAEAGAGGMAVVFRAMDRVTGVHVALKFLHADDLSPADNDRFCREAQILATLRHPNIVAYVDHGEAEAGKRFLAMEWLKGCDLSTRLDRGPLSSEDAVTLLRKIAEALSVTHARGVVHRDIKPSNIFLRDDRLDSPAILDFGIAKHVRATKALTRTGTMLGTPSYMAPEQVNGARDIGPVADIFSLGCVLYECLTGKPPFVGTNVAAVLAKILFQRTPSLRTVCPDVPEALELLLQRMLAKEPAERLGDAAAVLYALDHPQLPQSVPKADRTTLESGGTPALTTSERRIFSVVLAVQPAVDDGPIQTIDRSGLNTVIERLGAYFVWLPDGSLVAAITRSESAVDQAVHVARCALLIREHLPGAAVALATGRGQVEHGTLAGEVIDRAAALGRAGISAGVLVDALSADLLRARFRLAEVDGQNVLLGERDDADPTRLLLGKPTPCVGRDREFALLESTFADCIDNSASHVVLVTAPPGVGKSRLRHEFVRRIHADQSNVNVLFGMGTQPTVGSPYGVLAQALRRLCHVRVDEPLPVRREKFYARMGQHISRPSDALHVREFLGEMAGIPPSVESAPLRAARAEPRLMADQIQAAFLAFLSAECAHAPVCLVLEDLQWSDVLTVKLIDVALRKTEEQSFFVLALARPEVKDVFPGLWQARRFQEIRLAGLSRKAAERLVRDVLGAETLGDVVARIVTAAAGNALFLEEMIRAVAAGKADTAPDTVLAMVQARLMRLDTASRRVLRAASVYGASFRREGVAALLGNELTSDSVNAALRILAEAEILERRLDTGDDHSFRHALVRDAAYDLLTETDRVLGHRLALNYLEGQAGGESIVLAEHAVRGDEPGRAIAHFIRAAEQSFERNDIETVLTRAERGLACGARGVERGVLLALQCEGFFARGGEAWAQAIAASSEALDLLPPGSLWWSRAVGRLSVILPNIGQIDRMRVLADQFIASSPDPGAMSAYVGAMSYLVGMLASVGARGLVEAFSQRLSEISASLDPGDTIARAFLGLGQSIRYYSMDADPYEQLRVSRQSLALFEQVQDLRNVATMRFLLGIAEACAGDPAAAIHTFATCRELAERLEDRFIVCQCLTWSTWALTLLPGRDHLDKAREMACEAIAMDVSPLDTASAHHMLSRVLFAQGQLAEAESHLRDLVTMSTAMPSAHLSVRSTLCLVLAAQGRNDEARSCAVDGLAVLDAVGGVGFSEVDFLTTAAEVQLAAGDLEAGRRTLMRALERIRIRAERMPDAEIRRRFEQEFIENVHARDLAAQWLAYMQPQGLDACKSNPDISAIRIAGVISDACQRR